MDNISFSDFDTLAHWFWERSIKQINDETKEGHVKDFIGSSGITLVIGCPLPKEIQRRILGIRLEFDRLLSREKNTVKVKWRNDLSSLHITVYGLKKPADYQRGVSWPLQKSIIEKTKGIVSDSLGFKLVMQGLGILLGGTIGIRISNSDVLNQIRDSISKIEGVSEYAKVRWGEDVNKIIIGRFLTGFSYSNMQLLRNVVNDMKDFPIGEIKVNRFELVHYKHEFLDRLYEQHPFP